MAGNTHRGTPARNCEVPGRPIRYVTERDRGVTLRVKIPDATTFSVFWLLPSDNRAGQAGNIIENYIFFTDQEKLKLHQRPPKTAIAPHRRQRRHSGGPSYIETWVHRDQIHRHPELVKVAIVIALIVLKVVKVAQSTHNKNAKQIIDCNKNEHYMYITGSPTPVKEESILRQIG
ncbi:hypothetical protein R3P38DRAFT_2803780 [Favolaschia claudopus]|uniref:Reelin domain-containing protein n=1 Tax=Favolaschia claudopus TaxID=2862362 RepID=A0AAV9ZRZ1_9AGAR